MIFGYECSVNVPSFSVRPILSIGMSVIVALRRPARPASSGRRPPPAAAVPGVMVSDPVQAARFAAQLLTGEPAASAVAVVGRLLAVQGQDPRGARLAVRARSAGLTAADVDRALTGDRSLLITWLNRGTLHLVRSEDYWWLHALTTPQLATASARRLAQEGVPPADADKAVGAIEAALAADGPLTRAALRDRIASAGVRTDGQALVHVLVLASLRGLIVRGPMIGAEHAFVLVRDWLGAPPPPAGPRRGAGRAGPPLPGRARAGGRPRPGQVGRPAAARRPARPGRHPGPSWPSMTTASSAWIRRARTRPRAPAAAAARRLRPAAARLGVPRAGARRAARASSPPTASSGRSRSSRGRAAGTWSMARGKVTLAPFGPLAPADATALQADAGDVLRFLDLR